MLKLFSFLVIIPFFASSQNIVPKKQIQISAGTSFNGTGDIRGFAFNTEYGENFKKKLSWHVGMGGTIHDKVEPIFYTDQSGDLIDGSVRATTADFQVTVLYHIVFSEMRIIIFSSGPGLC